MVLGTAYGILAWYAQTTRNVKYLKIGLWLVMLTPLGWRFSHLFTEPINEAIAAPKEKTLKKTVKS